MIRNISVYKSPILFYLRLFFIYYIYLYNIFIIFILRFKIMTICSEFSLTISLSLFFFISPACLFRYNALSLVYLLYLLLLPWFTWPNKHSARGKHNNISHTSTSLSPQNERNKCCVTNLVISS